MSQGRREVIGIECTTTFGAGVFHEFSKEVSARPAVAAFDERGLSHVNWFQAWIQFRQEACFILEIRYFRAQARI